MTDSFQWERCTVAGGSGCADIGGATNPTYVSSGDIGDYVRARGYRDGVLIGESDPIGPILATPPPPTTVPAQGISLPLPNIAGKSTADQNWMLDQIVALGNGHEMFVRLDWFPGDAGFASVAAKIAARPSLHVLPILNYDPGDRPTQSVYAAQAAALAQLYPIVNLLNEPNLGGWTPTDAAHYTAAAYDAIAGDAVVVGPSAGFNKGAGHDPSNVLAWNQAYDTAGGKQDIGAVTCYGDAQFVDPAWNGWSVMPQLKALFGSMIVLEGGWQVPTPDSNFTPFNRSAMTRAAYQSICVSTGMAAVAADRVVSFLAYSLLNDASPGGFGLYDSSRVARPAYATFKAGAA